MSWIYRITNTLDGKGLVGSSKNKDPHKRWHEHKSLVNRDKHWNRYFQRAVNKHGLENFNYEIIEECSDLELRAREEYWIGKCGDYNLQDFPLPLPPIREETRRKLSKAAKRQHAQMTNNERVMRNALISERTSLAMQRMKMEGNTPWVHPHSEKTKEKLRKITRKQWQPGGVHYERRKRTE